jgi:hypothetical protein
VQKFAKIPGGGFPDESQTDTITESSSYLAGYRSNHAAVHHHRIPGRPKKPDSSCHATALALKPKFGKGKTVITMFKAGFAVDLDDNETPSEEHLLRKVRLSETVSVATTSTLFLSLTMLSLNPSTICSTQLLQEQ